MSSTTIADAKGSRKGKIVVSVPHHSICTFIATPQCCFVGSGQPPPSYQTHSSLVNQAHADHLSLWSGSPFLQRRAVKTEGLSEIAEASHGGGRRRKTARTAASPVTNSSTSTRSA